MGHSNIQASTVGGKPHQSQAADLSGIVWPPPASVGERSPAEGLDVTTGETGGMNASDSLGKFPSELSAPIAGSTRSTSALMHDDLLHATRQHGLTPPGHLGRNRDHAAGLGARVRAALSRPRRHIGHWRIDRLKVPALIALIAAQSIFILVSARPERGQTLAAPAAIPAALAQPANAGHPTATVVATPSASTPVAGASPKASALTGTVARNARLVVTSEPSGARASIDGRNYGTTPATVSGLSPGTHRVVLDGPNGSVTQLVKVTESASVTLLVNFDQSSRGAGWVSVALPIDVQIFEDGRLLGVSQSERIMLGAGMHRLELVNEALGYRATEQVRIEPNKVARIASAVPTGTVNINALPWAEVFIDGERAGETPLANLPVHIGAHQVVFRHPELASQSRTVVVTATSQVRLSVDLRK